MIIDSKTLSEWFPVESGVRHGCILSPVLFLVTIDWIMQKTTSDKPRGIQWTIFSHLEDLDFADDLAALSSKREHLQEKTDRLNKYGKQIGLNINTLSLEHLLGWIRAHYKSYLLLLLLLIPQVMCINTINPAPITVNGEPLDHVEDFTYLGSLISKDNGAKKDIHARLSKARGAFARHQTIWKSRQYNVRTKIRLYNSNVKFVLMYGSECWRVVKGDMDKINVFHNGCLRKICCIFWPNKVSNEELYRKTVCNSVIHEIKRWQLRWLGHTLRMYQDRIPKVALR